MAGGYGSKYVKGKFKWVLKLIMPPIPIQNIISKTEYSKISSFIFKRHFKILNVGSGDYIGIGAKLWRHADGEVINIDIQDGYTVDVVGDAHNLPFDDSSFDSIIMQAVLEHLHTPEVAISEAFRVLKPGGFLYLEVPFLQGFHADPHDYFRFTQVGLKSILKDNGLIILTDVSSGPFSALNWIIRDLFSNISPFVRLNLGIRFVLSWVFFPMKYFDFFVKKTKASNRLACEYYYLIKKV